MARNPNDTKKENDYIFEVHGEITVTAYDEEDAEYQLEENLNEVVKDAIRKGTVEVK